MQGGGQRKEGRSGGRDGERGRKEEEEKLRNRRKKNIVSKPTKQENNTLNTYESTGKVYIWQQAYLTYLS